MSAGDLEDLVSSVDDAFGGRPQKEALLQAIHRALALTLTLTLTLTTRERCEGFQRAPLTAKPWLTTHPPGQSPCRPR